MFLAARGHAIRRAATRLLPRWHVLADPEGNEFCLVKARLDPL